MNIMYDVHTFKLSLPVLVRGIKADGTELEEKAVITSINSNKAVLMLKSKILIGTKLNLNVDIPKTLFLENKFTLYLSGEVVHINFKQNKQYDQIITVELNKGYKIQPVHMKQ
jgi:hypothetical protein